MHVQNYFVIVNQVEDKRSDNDKTTGIISPETIS